MIKGICHAYSDFDKVKACGFEWTRIDCAYPYTADGGLSEHYQGFKNLCRHYHNNGLKVMAISPAPWQFVVNGIDVRTEGGAEKISEITEFIARDTEGLVDGWQVGNELNVYFFRAPYGFDDAIDFVAAGLKGINRANPDILLGYNFSEYDETSIYMMKKLLPYGDLYNYIGYDGYFGTWIPGGPEDFITAIDEIYELTGTDVLIQEFGFASVGGIISGSHELDEAVAEQYGFKDFADATVHCEEFLDKLPNSMSDRIRSAPREDWEANLRHLEPHILKKWPGGSAEYPHTPEGQAKWYDDLLEKLNKQPHLAGYFVFCWADSGSCFFCGADDCPCETAWGLVDINGNLKPSYHAVQKHLAYID